MGSQAHGGGTGTSLEAEEASSASDHFRLPGGLKVAAWLGTAGGTRFSAAALIPQEPLVGVGWGDRTKGTDESHSLLSASGFSRRSVRGPLRGLPQWRVPACCGQPQVLSPHVPHPAASFF